MDRMVDRVILVVQVVLIAQAVMTGAVEAARQVQVLADRVILEQAIPLVVAEDFQLLTRFKNCGCNF